MVSKQNKAQQVNCRLDYSQEILWERQYLRKKCVDVGLEEEYILYERRLRISFLGVFMCVLSAVTIIHCLLLLLTCEYAYIIYIDVGSYLGATTFTIIILSINFNEHIIKNHVWVMYATSGVAVATMVVVDIFLYLYHYHNHYWVITSFYDTFVLYAIYLFLPIPFVKGPLILGCCVSIAYVANFFTYLTSKYQPEIDHVKHFNRFMLDVVHYSSFNILGVFFRVICEIIVRSSFLDRYQYVMEENGLKSARKHERLLLHSILPPQIAWPFQENIRSRIVAQSSKRRAHPHHIFITSERIMSIQSHPDVSILYADVVNYTHLTTTLTVNALVTLLHDLYGRFDHAASHYKVQRIKFLGDCYYCVAGLSVPNPDHAKSCIDYAQCMIGHIREVRMYRGLNIDMRIGVHSGALFAGVIGATKLQYDIWGDDVMIASKLEATGRPGHVHISERTLGLIIDNTYDILPGTLEARDNDFLQKHNIKTFLIAAVNIKIHITDRLSTNIDELPTDEPIQTFEEELRTEFEKLPVGSMNIRKFFGLWKRSKEDDGTPHQTRPLVGCFFLHFKDPRLEYKYMQQPDYTLRYSVLLSWSLGISLIYVQAVNHTRWNNSYLFVDISFVLTMTILLIITWYKKFCYMRYKTALRRYSRISCLLFRIGESLQRSLISRIFIYMFTVFGYFCLIAVVLLDCDQEEYVILTIESKLYHYEADQYLCFHPWVLTNMVCLMMGVSVIFTRIPWIVKILTSALQALTYMIIIFFHFDYVMHHSITTNPYFFSEYAHSFIIVITLFSLYIMERHAEFNNKINYNWKVELLKKQEDAVITNKSITILLQIILPVHVANIFLTSLEKHELYYEQYKMVSVMFASLRDFQLSLANLRILNEVITEFDRILFHYRKKFLVEKIKIVGCTYMAACGLDTHSSMDFTEQVDDSTDTVLQEVTRVQHFCEGMRKNKDIKNEQVVFVITTFALDLLRTIWMLHNVYTSLPFDEGCFNCDLSIGISCGEVMAGVVGASQVHYDIWGNAVNMASRMDSTGIPGQIHVTKETALLLRNCGIQCLYRGMTFVKGRGILPTYLVKIDEDYEFVYTSEFSASPSPEHI